MIDFQNYYTQNYEGESGDSPPEFLPERIYALIYEEDIVVDRVIRRKKRDCPQKQSPRSGFFSQNMSAQRIIHNRYIKILQFSFRWGFGILRSLAIITTATDRIFQFWRSNC